jgi:hypothetical protein
MVRKHGRGGIVRLAARQVSGAAAQAIAAPSDAAVSWARLRGVAAGLRGR